MSDSSPAVLDGIRVLDFGRYIAGPFCGALLADLGAEVIRVEKLAGSEDRWTTPVTEGGDGALFLQVNRGKKSITLNPTKPEGREVVKKLVATADVVIANLPPQTLHAMSLDLESLRESKPDIILTTVTAYGRGGPYSDRVGFDGIGQVMSGVAYMTGQGKDDEPYRAAAPWVDFTTAISCAYGTLAALMARQQTGQGQQVEGSLLHSALTVGNSTLIEQHLLGIDREPTGNRGQTSAPSDIYQCGDGVWILVAVVGQPLFVRWAELLGEREEWLEDDRFKDDLARGDHGELISERMQQWCSERTSAEALELLGKAYIPAAPVLSPQQTLDDPHVREVGFLEPVPFPGTKKDAPVSRPHVLLSETPASIRSRAPLLGEHTDQVLDELGYDAETIARLREARIV